MKIVFDLQALQSPDSRHRGIGRYARALARAAIMQALDRGHEVHIALSHAFPDTIKEVKEVFADLVPQNAFHIFEIPLPVFEGEPRNLWRVKAAEAIREVYLQSLQPDVVHVSSLFEGFSHDCVTSCPSHSPYLTVVTLFDLIPYLKQEHYLADPRLRKWYMRKIEHLRSADLLLAISDYSRDEAIEVLQLEPDKVISISGDADEHFTIAQVSSENEKALRERLGLTRPFVMYTGGIDYRKNIEGLIEAYATLPEDICKTHQLAIVCNARPEDKFRLHRLASRFGASPEDIILTGYVSDADLVDLYRICKLFVFPSLHEGFGLPVLEAMRCGAAVLGSNATSIPEIIGFPEALFDAKSTTSIQESLTRGLSDNAFRQQLIQHSKKQAQKFSWAESARRTLDAFEAAHARHQAKKSSNIPDKKLRLAYVSPLPPDRSGIADYSDDLLPALAAHYEITLVSDLPQLKSPWLAKNLRKISVEEFNEEAPRFDRILYHFGNSTFHTHMFDLLEKFPGTVVLHDFFLSGLFNYLEATGSHPRLFQKHLYTSHGYRALRLYQRKGAEAAMWAYPCNAEVLNRAIGIIVHSDFSRKLASDFYAVDTRNAWTHIPLLRTIPQNISRTTARQNLKIAENAFLVCSFGMLDQTKLNHQLLEAWMRSSLSQNPNCHLVFIGACPSEDYRKKLQNILDNAGNKNYRVTITGFADESMYRDYLAAADIGVQLRERSRGETSAAMADCLVYGLPLLTNAHGSAAEIGPDLADKLPDQFTVPELTSALERLFTDAPHRQALSKRSLDYTRNTIAPEPIACRYYDAIEAFYGKSPALQNQIIDRLANLSSNVDIKPSDLIQIAKSIADNLATSLMPQIFLDMTHYKTTKKTQAARDWLEQELEKAPRTSRIEPIFWDGHNFRYARSFALEALGIPNPGLANAVISTNKEDCYKGDITNKAPEDAARRWLEHQVQRGLHIYTTETDKNLKTQYDIARIPA